MLFRCQLVREGVAQLWTVQLDCLGAVSIDPTLCLFAQLNCVFWQRQLKFVSYSCQFCLSNGIIGERLGVRLSSLDRSHHLERRAFNSMVSSNSLL